MKYINYLQKTLKENLILKVNIEYFFFSIHFYFTKIT